MRCIGSRTPIVLLALGLLAAWPALADDDESDIAAQDFSDFALQLDTSDDFDVELDWTEFELSDSRFAPTSDLHLDWPPAMSAGAAPRPNQVASWKPSSGMRVDYSRRDEAVFLRWRLGF